MQTFHLGEIHLFAAQGISELEDAFQLWLESMQARGLSPSSLTGYASEVGQFVRFLREQLNLTDLDTVQPHHIRKWLIYRQQKGVSNAQLHNDYRKPRTFWNWCLREKLTTNNPFASVEKPKLQPTLKPALTPDEVEQILQACKGKRWLRLRDKALCLLLLDTGLRIHEAHRLTVADASQDAVLIRGKGGKQRVVFLSHEVRLAIRRYLNACPYALTGDAPLWWGERGALLNALPRVHPERWVAAIRALEPAPDIVIVDTLRRFLPAQDENDAASVAAALEPFVDLQQWLLRTAIILVHHTKKSLSSDGEITDIAGSHAFTAEVDAILLLAPVKEHKRQRILTPIAGRLWNLSPEPLVLELSEDTSEYRVVGTAEEVLPETHAQSTREKILRAIRVLEQATVDEIAEYLQEHIPKRTIHHYLAQLHAEGAVNREGRGTRAEPYTYSCNRATA
jgi:site-specific recombinase XerC